MRSDNLAELVASVLRFRAIVGQHPIEENDFGRHLGDTAGFLVVGVLCRGNEQAEDQSGHRGDQTRGEQDRVFGM